MKLLFKQRIFSWFDSYDIYDEEQQPRYHVKGVMSLGHRLQIYDRDGNMLGEIKEKAFSFLPKFTMYIDGEEVGTIQKELTFLRPKFHLTCNDWIMLLSARVDILWMFIKSCFNFPIHIQWISYMKRMHYSA